MSSKPKLIALFFVGLFACRSKPVSHQPSGPHTISIGIFELTVPADFQLTYERGFDSSPGVIKGKSLELYFDYGDYTDSLTLTPHEFIMAKRWMDVAMIQYLDIKKHKNVSWPNTTIESYRPSKKPDSGFAKGCDAIAQCNYKGDKFRLPVFFPAEIKESVVKVDTVDHFYRRLVGQLHSGHGITGIYMRDERGGMFASMTYPAIEISQRDLNPQQQTLALSILKTLRPKHQTK